MKPGKLPIAGIILVLTVILFTVAFISQGPQANGDTARKVSQEPERVNFDSPQPSIPQPVSSSPDRDSPPSPSRDQEVAALQRMIDGLQAQAAEMAADNERMKAALHNLSLHIDWSKAKKPSPENWEQDLQTRRESVDKQRAVVKELREKAINAARMAGAPESVIDADITKVLILPPGPDYSALSQSRADLYKALQALQEMEMEYSNARMNVAIDGPAK